MTTLAQRVIRAVNEKACSLSELAAAAGVKPPSVTDWTNGKTKKLQAAPAHRAAKFLGVNFLWLTEGKGPMRPTDNANTSPGPDLLGMVPLISFVQAGDWKESIDSFAPNEAEEWLRYPKKNGDRVFALRVQGDSMTSATGRSYPDGCVIFVDPEHRSPPNGARIVAKLNGTSEVVFKVFMQDAGRIWLRALNRDYDPIREPFKVIGTVVGKWEDE